MSANQITITIPLDDLDKLRRDVQDGYVREAGLRAELEAERAKTPDERLSHARQLIEALKLLVDHAVANLSPEFCRDIPQGAMATAASLIDTAIGADLRDIGRADVWRERAEMIQMWRDKRKAREGWGEE